MATLKTYVKDLPLATDPSKFAIPGFDENTNAGAKALMSTLKGDTGPAPNISVTMTTVPYGTTPSVDKGGTNTDPTFNIKFPLAADGRTPIFQNNGTYIQYRYADTDAWNNLVALSTLKGDKGDKMTFGDLSDADIAVLQQPATDAAATANAAATNANTAAGNANAAMTSANNAASAANTAADNASGAAEAANTAAANVQDGKTAVFQAGAATSLDPSSAPAVSLSQTGIDTDGNPVYSLGLGIPKGDKGDSGDMLNLKDGTYREPGSTKDLPDLPDFADTAERDAYIVDDDAIAGQYDLYYHSTGGVDWSIVNNWGGVPGPKGTPGNDGDTPYIGDNGNWWIGSTDTGVKAEADSADLSALQIGGRNLVLKSNVPYSNTNYPTARYNLSEPLVGGETYTVQIKCTPSPTETAIWLVDPTASSGVALLVRLTGGVNGIYSDTRAVNPATIGAGTSLSVFFTPNTPISESSIEWIKIEKGNKATDWTPAPEDKQDTLTAAQLSVVNSGMTALSTTAPKDSAATPAAGTSTEVSRADHVHKSDFIGARVSTNLDTEIFGAVQINGSASAPTTDYYYVTTASVNGTTQRVQTAIASSGANDGSLWTRRRNSAGVWSAWKRSAATTDVVPRVSSARVLYGTDSTGAQSTYDIDDFATADDVALKQDKLTAGDGIVIDTSSGTPVISASGGGSKPFALYASLNSTMNALDADGDGIYVSYSTYITVQLYAGETGNSSYTYRASVYSNASISTIINSGSFASSKLLTVSADSSGGKFEMDIILYLPSGKKKMIELQAYPYGNYAFAEVKVTEIA